MAPAAPTAIPVSLQLWQCPKDPLMGVVLDSTLCYQAEGSAQTLLAQHTPLFHWLVVQAVWQQRWGHLKLHLSIAKPDLQP